MCFSLPELKHLWFGLVVWWQVPNNRWGLPSVFFFGNNMKGILVAKGLLANGTFVCFYLYPYCSNPNMLKPQWLRHAWLWVNSCRLFPVDVSCYVNRWRFRFPGASSAGSFFCFGDW